MKHAKVRKSNFYVYVGQTALKADKVSSDLVRVIREGLNQLKEELVKPEDQRSFPVTVQIDEDLFDLIRDQMARKVPGQIKDVRSRGDIIICYGLNKQMIRVKKVTKQQIKEIQDEFKKLIPKQELKKDQESK